jgi:hypothetical protein
MASIRAATLPPPIFVVADRRGIDDANALVLRLLTIGVVEQPGAIAKKHGNDVDFHFVDQTGLEVLLGDIGATAQGNVFAARSVPGPLKRHIDSFGDEVKSCSTLHLKRIAGVMGENEDRHMKRRIFSPPTVPGIIPPRPIASAKHVAAHDGGPNILEVLRGDIVVGTSRAALHVVDRTESPRSERPIVELFAALAQRMRDALLRTGDIAVQRHCDVELELCHRASGR